MTSISALLDLHGSTALVTGGGVGLGAAIARRFAEAGADVAITYHVHGAEAAALVDRIRQMGGRASAFEAPPVRSDPIDVLIAEAYEAVGPVNILVNNAGVYPRSPAVTMDEEEWDTVLDVNLKAAFLYARAVAAAHDAGRSGSIVNISSISALVSEPEFAHYSASKAGMIALTKNLALELAPIGFTVNTISPGLVDSNGDLEQQVPDLVERFIPRAPLHRVGQPEEIANAALFLVSPAARWITGHNLVVDGGVMVAPVY
jgi:NAD(P)-dependent dehydrogenase (short-subunit alcohol dehydrogenase family)